MFEELFSAKREKSPRLVPDFNFEQTLALAFLQDFISSLSPIRQLACLLGAAGTGKTFLLQELISQALAEGKQVAMSAPTHKAVRVLRNMASKFGIDEIGKVSDRVDFATIHSLCGVKPRIDLATGKQVFEIDIKGDCSIRSYDLVIIDEASMVSQDLYNFVVEAITGTSTKVIFSGDPCQLPPVGEENSQTFNIPDTILLMEIMRHSGPGVCNIDNMRESIGKDVCMPMPREDHAMRGQEESGLWVYQNREAWLERAFRDFREDRWRADVDFARILAYTNAAVKNYNERVHQMIFGEGADPFVKGQRLVAGSSVFEGENILMQNSEECLVTSYPRQQKWDGFSTWKMDVLTDDYTRLSLRVLDPQEQGTYLEHLAKLKAHAIGSSGWSRKSAWREFYAFQQKFADLTHLYALTVHKAQGSTFQRCYVDFQNCLNVHLSLEQRKRLVYTAYTRFAEQLIVLN